MFTANIGVQISWISQSISDIESYGCCNCAERHSKLSSVFQIAAEGEFLTIFALEFSLGRISATTERCCRCSQRLTATQEVGTWCSDFWVLFCTRARKDWARGILRIQELNSLRGNWRNWSFSDFGNSFQKAFCCEDCRWAIVTKNGWTPDRESYPCCVSVNDIDVLCSFFCLAFSHCTSFSVVEFALSVPGLNCIFSC